MEYNLSYKLRRKENMELIQLKRNNKMNNTKKLNMELNATRELQIYKELYQIGTIREEKTVGRDFFEYCKTKRNFVLLVLYDNEGKVYLKESGVDEFCLPGGEIFDDETIMAAVKRIIYNIDKTMSISDVEPLVFVENIFNCLEETVKHSGVIMLARSSHETHMIHKRYYPINEDIITKVNVFANKNVLEIYKNRLEEILKQNNGEFQDEEIETNQKYKMRYKFHNEFVKRFILTDKMKKKTQLLELMRKKCGKSKKLIDISCGDNSILFSFLDEDNDIDYVVANDISWSQIEFIPPKDKIIFTNHNAITFPFKDDAFDFVYCSNTLHHIPSYENLKNLLESLLRIGKKIVIYEIEDPKITKGLPYILNKYWYRGFLKDVGEQYLSYTQFRRIITSVYEDKASITFSKFKNIQGIYMIAEIVKK